MSYRVGTPNYNLPQTEGTDKRDWSDTNQAFLAIDTAIKNAVDTSATASSAADTAQSTADSATVAATHAQTDATTAQTLATSASELATLAKTTADGAEAASTANTAAIAQIASELTRTQTLISEQDNPLLRNYVRVLRYGDVVDISLNGLQNLVGQTNNKIFTLPEALRPLNVKYFGFAVSSYEYEISIATNGEVYVFPVEASPVYQDSIRLELTYII